MRKKLLVSFVLTMLLFVVVSPIGISVGVVDFDSASGDFIAQADVDWWPMFHHDLRHTGYSTSTAPNTSYIMWSYATGKRMGSRSPAVADGRVYYGSNDGNVYCLHASTGQEIWRYTIGSDIFSSPAVAYGKVYIGSYSGYVYCLDALTGEKIWSFFRPSVGLSSPAVVDGRVYIGMKSPDRSVCCLDAFNGDLIWIYATGDEVWSSPAVVDGRVYVGSFDDNVYCLDASTGQEIWRYTTGGDVQSSPAVVDGRVYVGSFDDNVYCLDASTGQEIWRYTTGGNVRSSPAVAYGKVYVGSADHNVYCLPDDDPNEDGVIDPNEVWWSYTTGGRVTSCPAVADGRVYVGSCDNNFYCLHALTGNLVWKYRTWDIVFSPAIADGKVYVRLAYDICAFGPTHTLTITKTNGGETDPKPGTHKYGEGTTATVTASPYAHYEFDHWELDGSWNYSNPISVTMNSDHALHAVFEFKPPETVWVDDEFDENTPDWGYDHFDKIQDGTDAVTEDGDVHVYNGIYYENVVVNKSLSLIGEDRSTTIIDGNLTGTVMEVTANNVDISGFTIQNSGIYPNYGIHISSSGNNISYNIITDNSIGIYFKSSSFNTFFGNNIENNGDGIYFDSSSFNIVSGNTIENNDGGISIYLSSDSNTIYENNIASNNDYGVWLSYSINNKFYHNNFIDNTKQVLIQRPGYANIWNDDYPSGGNYWSDYYATDMFIGSYQDEIGSDGIGDTPYIFDTYNQDRYPLLLPGHKITMESNTTITKTFATRNALRFETSGPAQTVGYINATLPADINNTAIKVFVDGNEKTPTITINGTHYFIYFEFIQSTHDITILYATYEVTIEAHCNTEGVDVSVSIVMDGSPTGYTTSHTFTGLTGTHNFTVPDTDPHGCPFRVWSTGETSTTITVTTGGTYTAYYDIDIHDVAIINVEPSKTVVCQGYTMNITVTVQNQGDVTETFDLTLYANETEVDIKEITLTSGHNITITFIWNSTGVAKGNYTMSAYAWPIPGDIDLTDNTFTDGWVIVAMVGDITGPDGWSDGKCDMRDVGLVARHFGETGPPGPPNCDVTGPITGVPDGNIDMRDIGTVARHFGEIDP